jgi:large subunit ribosomal protein L15
MPLIRRIPKKGFNALFKKRYQVVNLESLNKFQANSVVGPAEFKKGGLVASEKEMVKVLGDGKLTKALTVKAHQFSKSALTGLQAAGAKAEYLTKAKR